MESIRNGCLVECIKGFTGYPNKPTQQVHNSPPQKGEVLTVIGTNTEAYGELYLIFAEVSGNSMWVASRFRQLKDSHIDVSINKKNVVAI